MAATVTEEEVSKKANKTEKRKQLSFLYKFEPGVAQSSFGIVVARKAGLNERVLEIAQRKAS